MFVDDVGHGNGRYRGRCRRHDELTERVLFAVGNSVAAGLS
jgi:hypothetical protein